MTVTAEQQVERWAARTIPRLAVPSRSAAMRAWRRKAKRRLRELLHLPRSAKVARSHVTGLPIRRGDVRIHRVSVEPAGEEPFEALILEPASISTRRPGWLCLHGAIPGGAAAVSGYIDSSPACSQSLRQFECDYALQLARRGYVTMTFHFPGFGPRGSSRSPDSDVVMGATLLDRTYLGWCLSNAMAALTVLSNWPAVRHNRIGVVGFSMGATLAGMLAALDSRVRAAALSGRFPSWRERIYRRDKRLGPVCCVPGLLAEMDVVDMLSLAAPTTMFVSQETRGNVMRSRKLLQGLRHAYSALKSSHHLTIHYDNATRHRFVGEPLYRWIETLDAPPDSR